MWKRAKAEHRCAVMEEKRESWIKLASSFNSRTSKATIYENLRKIKGTPKRKINILKDGNQYYTTHNDIANKLGKTFSETSSATNYKQNFKVIKENEERIHIVLF